MQRKADLKKTISFSARFDQDIWEFLQYKRIEQKRSINMIVEDCVRQYKKKFEKRLTPDDGVIS